MEFRTQKELLEHLGKNPNDRSLVQRMITRWEVFKENGMYYLVDKDKKISDLENLVANLRSEIATMKESNWDLEEAKAQWEYYKNLYEAEKEDKQNRIRRCFRWIKQIKPSANWEEFREWIMNDEE